VDHNRIRSSLSRLSDRVTAILDHHEDENSHGHVTIDSGNRVIAFDNGLATVASTCTLVTERLIQTVGPSARIDRELGLVLLGTILLDSVNMLPEAGKGTDRDEAALQTLLNNTGWSSSVARSPSLVDDEKLSKIFPDGQEKSPDRTALFDALSGAKFDSKFWREMSARDCLRIDYKKFPVIGDSLIQSIGISTVLMDMNSVTSKENFFSTMADFVNSENVDIFGVMTMSANDEGAFVRELLLAGCDANLVNSISDHLLNHPDASFLQITENASICIDGNYSEIQTRVFSQGNTKGSRKQVAPVLLSYASSTSRL
jgi:exopolyphosphatase